jgi:hypothetical protein
MTISPRKEVLAICGDNSAGNTTLVLPVSTTLQTRHSGGNHGALPNHRFNSLEVSANLYVTALQ